LARWGRRSPWLNMRNLFITPLMYLQMPDTPPRMMESQTYRHSCAWSLLPIGWPLCAIRHMVSMLWKTTWHNRFPKHENLIASATYGQLACARLASVCHRAHGQLAVKFHLV